MKKLFLLFVFCCFAGAATAQNVETVYLKSGGKIRGIITEQTPNQTLQIQTADGKVVICAYDAIKKIETTDEKVVIGTYGTIEKNTNGLPEQNLNTASFRPHYEENVASAQFIEVVHLKNGGMIRGTITEQIPNQSLKIQTADGSVFVYSFDEIEKSRKKLLPDMVFPTDSIVDLFRNPKNRDTKVPSISVIRSAWGFWNLPE